MFTMDVYKKVGRTSLVALLFLVAMIPLARGQAQTVRGKVLDETSKPINGASVQVKGQQKSTTTDQHGDFSIEAQRGDVLQISFVGYRTSEQEVVGTQTLTIALATANNDLDEEIGRASWRDKWMSG